MGKKLTLSSRQKLETILSSRDKKVMNTISEIADKMGYTTVTLYKELKLGLSEEDYLHKNYQNYSAKIAQSKKEEELLRRERQ